MGVLPSDASAQLGIGIRLRVIDPDIEVNCWFIDRLKQFWWVSL